MLLGHGITIPICKESPSKPTLPGKIDYLQTPVSHEKSMGSQFFTDDEAYHLIRKPVNFLNWRLVFQLWNRSIAAYGRENYKLTLPVVVSKIKLVYPFDLFLRLCDAKCLAARGVLCIA